MKKRRAARCLTLLLLLLFVGGCSSLPQQYRIEDIQNILVAGIDTYGDDIILTVLADAIESGSQGGSQTKTKLYMSTGKTLFEAKRKLHEYAEKRLSFFHMQYVIIGEQAARQGIDRYMDFFCEDDETFFLHNVLIAGEMTAADFLQQACAQGCALHDYLSALTEQAEQTGVSGEFEVLDYLISRERPWNSLAIPMVTLFEDPAEGEEGGPTSLVKLGGMAFFWEDQLMGFLDEPLTRGVNLITNEMSSAAISVKDNKDRYVALEVMKASAEIKPRWGDPLEAAITVSIQTNLVEYAESDDMTLEEYIAYLERQENAYIQEEIERTLWMLQQNQVDIIGLGDAFYHQYPHEWQGIRDNWLEVFSGVKITVEVRSSIQYTYNLVNGVGQ